MRRMAVLLLAALVLAAPASAGWWPPWTWLEFLQPPAGKPFAIGCGGFTSDGWAPARLIVPDTGETRDGLRSTINLNCGSEQAELAFGIDVLTGDLGGKGLLAKQGGVFRVKSVGQTAQYEVLNDNLPVYRTTTCSRLASGITEAEAAPFNNCNMAARDKHPLGYLSCSETTSSITQYTHGIEGVKGKLKTPNRVFRSEMEIVLDDGTKIPAVVSSAQGRAFFKKNNRTLAVFQWSGNLDTGRVPPEPRDVVAIYALQPNTDGKFDSRTRGGWVLASDTDWQTYTASGVLAECTRGPAPSEGLLKGGASIGEPGKFTSDGRFYEVELGPGEVIVPQGTLWIDGEVLGVSESVGRPVIVGLTPPSGLVAGESRDLSLTVKNNGSMDGSFALRVSCGGLPLGVESKFDVARGKTETVTYPMSFATDGTRSCDARVCDVSITTGGARCDSRSFSVAVAPLRICDPGDTIVEGTEVYQCNAAGSALRVILRCTGTQSINTGPQFNPATGERVSTGTVETVLSMPEYVGGVWRCSGSSDLQGGGCQAYRSSVLQQIEAGSCQLVCDIGDLPLAVDVSVGSEVVNLESGTLREVGCTPPVDASPGLPVVNLTAPKKTTAPKKAPPVAKSAPQPPGFEAVFAVAILIAVGMSAARIQGRGPPKG